jgi:hypothetical protein
VDLEDDSSVIIRCGHNSGISVRLFDRQPMEDDPDGVYYDIELQAPGLHAVIERVVAWKHHNGVDGFLGSIAADRWPPRPPMSAASSKLPETQPLHRVACYFKSWRDMTTRWIWLVPS